jgi:predicted nucleotidyltransferase
MAKTAKDLSQEELRSYHPWQTLQRYHKDPEVSRRWDSAWDVARKAARLLQEQFGATRVVVFGSLVRRAWFAPWSDVDLAVWGLPAEKFYRAIGAVHDFGAEAEFKIDVIEPAECSREMVHSIQTEGIEL